MEGHDDKSVDCLMSKTQPYCLLCYRVNGPLNRTDPMNHHVGGFNQICPTREQNLQREAERRNHDRTKSTSPFESSLGPILKQPIPYNTFIAESTRQMNLLNKYKNKVNELTNKSKN